MSRFAWKITIAALAGILLNAPFAIGEFLTRDVSGPRTGFPLGLFVGLWLEAVVFAYVLMSVIKIRRQGAVREKWILFIAQILVLGVFGWAWTVLIIDQWPCFFLGGSGC